MQISKTDYMHFLKHPAWAWYRKNNKKALPPVSADLQARFDAGHAFEEYAEAQFKDAVRLEWDGFQEYATLPKRTQAALDDGADVLLQGRFEGEGTTCIIDVLQRVKDNEFDLFEIKSSTKVKPEYIDDLAFQVTVLEDAGLSVRNVGVIHVNSEYVRSGDIEAAGLASRPVDITKDVMARRDVTREQIKKAIEVVSLDTCPDMSPRFALPMALRDWLEVYAHIEGVQSDSIFMLARRTPKMIGALEDMGVTRIADIPDDFRLSEKQELQVFVTKSGKQAIQAEPIKNFLENLEYPLYFLDYETFSGTVPAFDGVRPYQQVPFQYALYKIEKPGAELEFAEYLHEEATHPAEPLVASLKDSIGDKGSVLVWYQSFEKGCNDTLAAMVPAYADFLKDMNKRIVDLMVPFSSGWFVDKDFYGSASIKRVLPTLVPKLSYADLDIHEGQQAQREWMEVVLEGKGMPDKASVMENLREYCKQDVFAMVEILRQLEAIE